MITLITVLVIIFAYFIGSISSAILVCKFFCLVDPRYYASKNPGATNVFRIAGYKLAIVVVLFDFLKGAIPIWLGSYFEISSVYLQITAMGVCLGHIFPIFFQFFGGKGVATAFGALTAISFDFFIVMTVTWLFIVFIFRYVSLGSIITAVIMPFYAWCKYPQYFILVVFLSLLILIRHFDNIKRLWLHQEKKIWSRDKRII